MLPCYVGTMTMMVLLSLAAESLSEGRPLAAVILAVIAEIGTEAGTGFVFEYTGGASGRVYGYSIDVLWDPAVATATVITRMS